MNDADKSVGVSHGLVGPVEDDRIIGPSEAAKLLGVTLKTLRIWEDEGSIPCVRTPGNHRRFSYLEVKRFIDRKKEWSHLEKICAVDMKKKIFGEKSIDFGLCTVSMTKINDVFVLDIMPNECLPSREYVEGATVSFQPTEYNITSFLFMSKNADEVRKAKENKKPIMVFTGVAKGQGIGPVWQ